MRSPIVIFCVVAASACELSVYTPQVTTVGDGATGDSRAGDRSVGDGAGDSVAGDPAPRIDGASCNDGSQCQSTICIDEVCCAEACDLVCERCDDTGACVADTDDDGCGVVDCDDLDSTCRDYDDPSARCNGRGVCKISNSSDCTDYLDATPVTGCDDSDPGTAPDLCNGGGSCVGTPVVLAKVGSFNIGDDAAAPVGTVVPITGVGFRPEVVFLWWSGRTTDTTTVTTSNGRQHYRRGVGFATGPGAERLVTNQAENNTRPSADTDRMYREDGCISSLTTGRSLDGLAELTSFDDDGFSLEIVFDSFGSNLAVSYLALGGGAITNATVGTFASPAVAGTTTQDITGVGFQPDVVFFLSGYGTEAPPYSTSSGVISVGAATGSALEENASLTVAAPNSATPPWSGSYALLGESLVTSSTWVTLYERGKVAAFQPDGFQIEWIELDDDDAYLYFYLAIAGGNPHIGTLLTENDLSTDVVVTGVGYRPASALLFSRGEGESTADSGGGHDRFSIGGFSAATEQWVQATHHYRVSGDPPPSSASAALSSENIYFRLSDGGGSSAAMQLVSVDADGFSARMTDSDSSPRFVWFVTFGPGPP